MSVLDLFFFFPKAKAFLLESLSPSVDEPLQTQLALSHASKTLHPSFMARTPFNIMVKGTQKNQRGPQRAWPGTGSLARAVLQASIF